MSAYASGAALEVVSAKTIFLASSCFPLLVAAVSIIITEERAVVGTSKESQENDGSLLGAEVQSKVNDLWSAVTQREVWLPAAFMFCWQATPSAGTSFFYFMTNDLGFKPEFLGRVQLAGSIAGLAGVWIYQKFLRTAKISDVLLWSSLASLPPGLLQLALVTHYNRAIGIPDTWFAVGDDVVLTVLGQIAFMPTLVLAAKLCPPGVEGTLFALLMSSYNGAGILSSELGALLTKVLGVTENDFTNLSLLVVVCNLSSLLPLPFLYLLDDVSAASQKDALEEEAGILDVTATVKDL